MRPTKTESPEPYVPPPVDAYDLETPYGNVSLGAIAEELNRLHARIDAVEARQRKANMHDLDCRLDEILGKWKQSDRERFTGGFFTTVTHEAGVRAATDSRFPHLEDPETVLRRALKRHRLADEWINPCDCWLQETTG